MDGHQQLPTQCLATRFDAALVMPLAGTTEAGLEEIVGRQRGKSCRQRALPADEDARDGCAEIVVRDPVRPATEMRKRSDVAIEKADLILTLVDPREIAAGRHQPHQKQPRLPSHTIEIDEHLKEIDLGQVARPVRERHKHLTLRPPPLGDGLFHQRHADAMPVPTEYSVRVVAVAVVGRRLLPFSGRMTALFIALLASFRAMVRARVEVAAEILALRHQLAVLQRTSPTRPRLRAIDRVFWIMLSSVWPNWRQAMRILKPATVVGWHRRAFTTYWRWKSRPRPVGRPALATDLRALIHQMRDANPLWGAPRIHGELQKLGIEVSQATVAKYLGRRRGPPSQSWRTFLTNHVSQLASIDFFTVPTVTFRVLFVFVVLSHDRRRIVHLNVTAHPTAVWTAQQLREAFPWDTAPRFVIRDRDAIYALDPQRTIDMLVTT